MLPRQFFLFRKTAAKALLAAIKNKRLIMKTTKTQKATTSNLHSSNPFFNKSGEGIFFSQTKESEIPFFNPYPIQNEKCSSAERNDKYEQEADMTAEKVVRKLETPHSSLPIQKKCENCEQEEKLQKKRKNRKLCESLFSIVMIAL